MLKLAWFVSARTGVVGQPVKEDIFRGCVRLAGFAWRVTLLFTTFTSHSPPVSTEMIRSRTSVQNRSFDGVMELSTTLQNCLLSATRPPY